MKRTLATITPYAGNQQVRFCIIGLLGLSVAMVTSSTMADVYVGTGKTVQHRVDGNVTQNDSVVIGERGTLVKTGEGTWTLPTSKLAQEWEASVKVAEGTMSIECSAPERHAFSGVSNVLSRAYSWLDSSKSDSIVRDGSNNITDWLDARENPSASPYSYPRAKAVTDIVSRYPVLQTTNGITGLYFHGYKSGCYARLVTPSDAQAGTYCYNVFAVHGQFDKLGTIFGTRKSPGGNYLAFESGSSGGAFSPLWNCTSKCGIHNARTYVNGMEVDGFSKAEQAMPAEFCLLDVDIIDGAPGLVQCFFNDQDYWNSSTVSGYQKYSWAGDRIGGEYLCEVLLFNVHLTEAERLAVEGYLMEKWFGIRHASSLSVEVADGATVRLSGTDSSVPVTVAGGGALVESGTGVKDIEYAESFSGLAGYRADGMTLVGYDLVPYLARAGESVSVSETTDGYVVAGTAANGESLVKTGAGPLVIRSVPESVKTLTVSEGTLTVRPAAAVAEAAAPEAVNLVSNGSFEEGRESFTYYQNLGNGVDFHGWHITTSGSSMEAYVNHTSNSGGYNTSSQYIKLPLTVPDGECVLVLNDNATAQTSFTPTESGDYEVSFYLSTRERSASVNHVLGVYLGPDGGEMACLGAARALDYNGRFTEFRFKAGNLTAGTTYLLKFAPLQSFVDRTSVLDDVKVCKVDASRPFELPNGGFEYFKADANELVSPFEFSSANMTALEGWTLTNEQNFQGAVISPVFQGTYTVSGTAAQNSPNWGGKYFCPQENANGASQLYMGLGTKASVTFTPPAGTYRIRAKSALRIIGSATTPRADFACTATIGGTAQSLGSFRIDSTLMRLRTFDLPFSVDGTEEVALALTSRRVAWNDVTSSGSGDHSALGLIIDDVELVPVPAAAAGNLVQAPGFETGALDCWGVQGGDWANSGYADNVWGAQRYTSDGAHISSDGASLLPSRLCAGGSNNYYLRIHGAYTVTQQVTVAEAGRYTLSVYGRKRVKDDGTIFESAPVQLSLSKDGRTIEAGGFAAVSTNFCRHAWNVVIDDPGSWTLNVQTTGGNWIILDEFALVRNADAAEVSGDWESITVVVAQGAKLDLDYTGTNKVYSVRLGNHRRTGIISAETCPDFVSGSGALEASPVGTVMVFR